MLPGHSSWRRSCVVIRRCEPLTGILDSIARRAAEIVDRVVVAMENEDNDPRRAPALWNDEAREARFANANATRTQWVRQRISVLARKMLQTSNSSLTASRARMIADVLRTRGASLPETRSAPARRAAYYGLADAVAAAALGSDTPLDARATRPSRTEASTAQRVRYRHDRMRAEVLRAFALRSDVLSTVNAPRDTGVRLSAVPAKRPGLLSTLIMGLSPSELIWLSADDVLAAIPSDLGDVSVQELAELVHEQSVLAADLANHEKTRAGDPDPSHTESATARLTNLAARFHRWKAAHDNLDGRAFLSILRSAGARAAGYVPQYSPALIASSHAALAEEAGSQRENRNQSRAYHHHLIAADVARKSLALARRRVGHDTCCFWETKPISRLDTATRCLCHRKISSRLRA